MTSTLSQEPDLSLAQRFARLVLWRAKLHDCADASALKDDWDKIRNNLKLRDLLHSMASELDPRMKHILRATEVGSSDQHLKDLFIQYKDKHTGGADVRELTGSFTQEFEKWLKAVFVLLQESQMEGWERLGELLQYWIKADQARLAVIEQLLIDCANTQRDLLQTLFSGCSNRKLLAQPAEPAGESTPKLVGVSGQPDQTEKPKPAEQPQAQVPATAELPGTTAPSETKKEQAGWQNSPEAKALILQSRKETTEEKPSGEQPVKSAVASEANKAPVPPLVPVPPVSPWQYKPVPEGTDKHTEYDARAGVSPGGESIVGARVRGKKHKHEGTNCDDWFEFKASGPWTILAVSDGGGSYKYSRVGAKLSCQAVVNSLAEGLLLPEFAELAEKATQCQGEEAGQIQQRYCELVGGAIKTAMRAALDAVLKRIEEWNPSPQLKAENNSITTFTLRDFYATLLVAVHTRLQLGENTYSLVIGCGCGDGMIGVLNNSVDADKTCTLLMKPDSGEFSGEVDFLTEKSLTEHSMQGRIYPGFFGQLKAVLLVTDGVADDYFPNNPGMSCLYADLILNRIVSAPPACTDEALSAALQGTSVPALEDFKKLDITVPGYRVLETGNQPVKIASLAELAKKLGMEKDKLALNQVLLAGACQYLPDPLAEIEKAEDRLVHWLDAYTIRGSFDDRTLLVMYSNPKAR